MPYHHLLHNLTFSPLPSPPPPPPPLIAHSMPMLCSSSTFSLLYRCIIQYRCCSLCAREHMYVQFQEVVAIVMNDAASSLTYSCTEFKAALKALKCGDTNITKDFLDPEATTTTITRQIYNIRRKCCTVVMTKLPLAYRKQ